MVAIWSRMVAIWWLGLESLGGASVAPLGPAEEALLLELNIVGHAFVCIFRGYVGTLLQKFVNVLWGYVGTVRLGVTKFSPVGGT